MSNENNNIQEHLEKELNERFPVEPSLIRRDLSAAKLPKKAFAILRKCDRVIGYYQMHRPEQREVSLFPNDYRDLAKLLREAKLDIDTATYRGYGLKRASV